MPEEKSFCFKDEPERLDKFISRSMPEISRTYAQKLIKDGYITINSQKTEVRRILAQGDKVHVNLPDFLNLPDSSSDNVPILYEDSEIIIVNKPAGLVVHPAGPHQKDTLIQKLWPKLSEFWSSSVKGLSPARARPGVVHRLDKGTSGVMVIAKNPKAAENLSLQFAGRKVKKVYYAIVRGMPASNTGKIKSMVGRSNTHPSKMSVESQGKWSETEFKIIKRFPKFGEKGAALLEVRPLTGRTHQIRVQLSSINLPILGDAAYGTPEDKNAPRPLLHAFSLTLTHPKTKKLMTWTAPVTDDFNIYE